MNGLTANHSATNTAWLHRRVHAGNSVSGVLAQRVHALQGLQCRANIARRTCEALTTSSLRRSPGFREGSALRGNRASSLRSTERIMLSPARRHPKNAGLVASAALRLNHSHECGPRCGTPRCRCTQTFDALPIPPSNTNGSATRSVVDQEIGHRLFVVSENYEIIRGALD